MSLSSGLGWSGRFGGGHWRVRWKEEVFLWGGGGGWRGGGVEGERICGGLRLGL